MNEAEPYLNSREAAEFLGVSRAWVTKHIAELPCVKLGDLSPRPRRDGKMMTPNGRLFFRASELAQYIESHRVPLSPQNSATASA